MSPQSYAHRSRRLLISALAIFAVMVVCIAYIIGVVLNTPLTSTPRHVTVDLSATGGLFQGSSVTYRGVRVGSITDIRFTRDGVQAIARLDSGVQIPADTRAVVRSLSPVGEQYLDFQPPDAAGPYLHDGSVVHASHTDIPQTLASTVIALNKVMDQVDPDQLHTVLREAHRALQGTGPDLARMVDQGQQIIHDLNEYWPQTDRLLHNGGTLLDIGTDNAARLTRFAHHTRLFAAFLKSYDPHLAELLRTAPGQLRTLKRLVRDVRRVAPRFLALGAGVEALLASYDPHLRALLGGFATGLGVLAKAISDGALQLSLIVQRDDLCDYSGQPRSPTSTTRVPLDRSGHCPGSLSFLQRGAAHAPGPVD